MSKLDFEIKTTLSLIKEKRWRDALFYFHDFLGRFLLSKQAKSEQDEIRQFEKKELLQTLTLHENLTKMISVLNPDGKNKASKAIDPLCEALRLIGNQLDIVFRFDILKHTEGEVKEQVERVIERETEREGKCVFSVGL